VKFKLDENLPSELARYLHVLGHDADTVGDEELRGAPDPVIVQAAGGGGRVLLTLDKGIANIQRYPIHQHAGVVLFRPHTLGRRAVLAFVQEHLKRILELNLTGRLIIVGPNRIRSR